MSSDVKSVFMLKTEPFYSCLNSTSHRFDKFKLVVVVKNDLYSVGN